MATQILRTLDRWRFELPLALLLAAAAGFATMAMPHPLFAQVPVAGGFGLVGQVASAAIAALGCGLIGYVAMRHRPAEPAPPEERDERDDWPMPLAMPAAPEQEPEPVRLRRADRHPDAPPREPILASRDLGEPFMEVAAPALRVIEDAAFEPVKIVEAPAIDEPVMATPIANTPAESPPVPVVSSADTPVAESAPARHADSLAGMMDRLSAGMQRRGEAVGRPLGSPRDRSPALRDALEELNRLAARRG